jgi:hypothetical protein
MFDEFLSWLPILMGVFLLFTIFLKASDPKSLFGTDSQKLGSVSYKKKGVTTTVNIYKLAKRDETGRKMMGIEIRRVAFAGFRVQNIELNYDHTQHLIEALQKGID